MNNTSENDLQKAIDDIARANGSQGDGGAGGFGGGADIAPPPAPVIPVVSNGTAVLPMPGAENVAKPEAQETPAVTPVPVATPEVPKEEAAPEPEEAPKDEFKEMDAGVVREKAIDDLKPIIGTVDLTPILAKVELLPETKFKVFRNIIETTRDRGVLGLAYATAKEITDDTARAEALLYLVEMADKLV